MRSNLNGVIANSVCLYGDRIACIMKLLYITTQAAPMESMPCTHIILKSVPAWWLFTSGASGERDADGVYAVCGRIIREIYEQKVYLVNRMMYIAIGAPLGDGFLLLFLLLRAVVCSGNKRFSYCHDTFFPELSIYRTQALSLFSFPKNIETPLDFTTIKW